MPTTSPKTRTKAAPFRPIFHVTPKDDTYTHVVDADGTCWCCPECDLTEPDEVIFIHNSYDRREDYADGLRKPH